MALVLMMDIESIVRVDEEFSRLNTEISDGLMRRYFLPAPSKIYFAEDKFRLEHDSLRGYGLRFHEKWEIRELLRTGLTEEEITSDHGYNKRESCNDVPHHSAQYHEHRFYQRIGERLSGIKIPILALKAVRDCFEIQRAYGQVFNDFGEFYRDIEQKEITRKDVRNAIRLFEKTEWKFRNRDGIFDYLKKLQEEGEISVIEKTAPVLKATRH